MPHQNCLKSNVGACWKDNNHCPFNSETYNIWKEVSIGVDNLEFFNSGLVNHICLSISLQWLSLEVNENYKKFRDLSKFLNFSLKDYI